MEVLHVIKEKFFLEISKMVTDHIIEEAEADLMYGLMVSEFVEDFPVSERPQFYTYRGYEKVADEVIFSAYINNEWYEAPFKNNPPRFLGWKKIDE